jgi:thymidine phosphorylase
VLDVKVGRGAFMKTRDDARALGQWLCAIASRNGVRTEALLTPMDAPLGRAVGNASEVIESIETLKGRGPRDLEALSVRLAARMLVLAGLADGTDSAEARVREAIASGAGVERFREIIEAQGGDPRVIDDYGRLPACRHREAWTAARDGVVTGLDAELVGRAAVALGAGRDRADAAVDPAVGIEIAAPVGAPVQAGDPVLILACDDADRIAAARALLATAVTIGENAEPAAPFVLEMIGAESGPSGERRA